MTNTILRTEQSNTELLELFTNLHFSKNFQFRKYQKNAILSILNFYDKSPQGSYFLDAPTGSGKSIIALCVAGVLSFKGKSGYILASDIALQEQYEKDLATNKFKWGSVKGINNYICNVNFEKHSLGDCHIKGMSSGQRQELGCFATCPYYSNRLKSIQSPVAILNYSYWLIQRNYVAPRFEEFAPFKTRDFIIADEAHKISDIVQSHFSPLVTNNTKSRLISFQQFLLKEFDVTIPISSELISKNLTAIYKTDDKYEIENLLQEFESYLFEFDEIGQKIKSRVTSEYKGREVPKSLFKGFAQADWIKDLHNKISDYNKIIFMVGQDSIVKNQSTDSITFNCLNDNFLMKKYFHEQSNFQLFMTATMGDVDNFAEQIDIKDKDNSVKYSRIPSLFDFEKSPIYVYTGKKMSLAHKDKTFPWLMKKIIQIIIKHKDECGIIHSGSYQLTKEIYNMIPDEYKERVIIYENSEEKKGALMEFEESKNKILMGPSLLEGLDLKDDNSRFQVFTKIPYPSLADKFVKAKSMESRFWYDWKTIIGVLQGIGRSIRSVDDWAVTYVLDGSLGDLINRNRSSFPPEFFNRMKIIIGK